METFIGVLIILLVFVILLSLWAYGTLLKKALGKSKWNALLLLIPLVNLGVIIDWGVEAGKIAKNAYQEKAPNWFLPVIIIAYTLWSIILLIVDPYILLYWLISQAVLLLFDYWSTIRLLTAACGVPSIYLWALPLPGVGAALPVYYAFKAHDEMKGYTRQLIYQAGDNTEIVYEKAFIHKPLALILALITGMLIAMVNIGALANPEETSDVTVEGVVLDKLTNAPISNATITCLQDSTILDKATTDEEGKFTMTNIPKDATLRITAQDYESAEFLVPTKSDNTLWEFKLSKTPEATAEIIAKSFLHGVYEDIYPYLEPDIQQQYSRDTYVESFRNLHNVVLKMAASGDILENMRITELNRVSEDEVRVLATITIRSFKTGHTATLPATFTLTRAKDGTWRSNWPVPSASD
ncbi:CarboxypepD_reg-like domain-containing protein [Caldanaerobius fijiensis DSM 17918]|uniref:CarboxypepD_reg-like domain-containing protein n=1 Tax=Caldanaerobius fijiensis DSM 17918 TaxID=1121256 RepID=A0A1M5F0R2_9THEO|nr:carboxypeptidase regulatory-like domain-containing protein [Caldanaerobius fijiensis]SHF85089.1 CarboxypepD_reg-like domain-containing protein [Caldanaerobius fijiensis DSM 17918]